VLALLFTSCSSCDATQIQKGVDRPVEKQYRVVQCNMTLLGGHRSDRVTVANIVFQVNANGIE
jgi:hypothetical protein